MSDLSGIDEVGFGAAALVLATFCMRSMSTLCWIAIASNVAFIAYGYLGGLAPVLLLHMLLLPVNAYRLAQLRRARVPRHPAEEAGKRGRDSEQPPFLTIRKVKPETSRRAALPDGRVSWMQ